jgi:hypothetical protein
MIKIGVDQPILPGSICQGGETLLLVASSVQGTALAEARNGSPDSPLFFNSGTHTQCTLPGGLNPKRQLLLISSHTLESFLSSSLSFSLHFIMIAPSRGASVLLLWETWGVGIWKCAGAKKRQEQTLAQGDQTPELTSGGAVLHLGSYDIWAVRFSKPMPPDGKGKAINTGADLREKRERSCFPVEA